VLPSISRVDAQLALLTTFPRLFHPSPDLLLERAVASHVMSLAATLPRAVIAWLSGD
jgi:hypothetical protein